MGGKRLIYAVSLIAVIAAAVLAAVSTGLPIHVPAWMTVLIGAAVLGAGLAKGLLEALSVRLSRPLQQSGLRDEAFGAVGGRHERVEQVTGRLVLNIHAAIPLPEESDPELSEEYPEYVPRDLDADLRAWLRGHTVAGGLVVLVGGSAAGKTRCLYEALRAEVPDWYFLRPDTGQKINALVAAGADLSRCVLWLDDIEKFFVADAMTGATVKQILMGRHGNVLLAGTVRSEELDRLVAGPLTRENQSINQNAQEVLGLLARWSGRPSGPERAVRFDTSSRFSDLELARAVTLASLDPRLNAAVRLADHGNVTAVLAGTDDLINHWKKPSGHRGGQAVITAAVLARSCGYSGPIPVELLEILAMRILAAEGNAPADTDWLDGSLRWAKTPVGGEISAILAVRTSIGQAAGYRVSDILVEFAQDQGDPSLQRARADEATWRLLLARSAGPVGVEIGVHAYYYGMRVIAEEAWQAAADQGDTRAMRNLGWLWEERDDQDAAERWYTQAADGGDTDAMTILGHRFFEAAVPELAERWFRQAASLGSIWGMSTLGFYLSGRGAPEEAEIWYLRAAELGDSNAMCNLGYLLQRQGDVATAEHWYRASAELHHSGAMGNLARLLRDQGDIEGALIWYRDGAEQAYADVIAAEPGQLWPGEGGDLGQSNAMLEFGELLAEQGQKDDAEQWFKRGAALGDPRAADKLATSHAERGDTATSNEWRRTAADLAHGNLSRNAFSLVAAYGKSAVLRHSGIMLRLAEHLAQAGELTEAETWAERAAIQGNPHAMRTLVTLMSRLDRLDEAERWSQLAEATEGGELGGVTGQA
ncbi:tetratricopeptide repeat protein [Streptomyces sp. NPDC019890]|uniref:tetratricopeptide repeat protein n=1 Tax=Streptomyces sp. NPDC019890 TaxID=3365064 RepID=UPI00384B6DFA